MLTLAGVGYSLGLSDADPDGLIEEHNAVFCTQVALVCTILGDDNYALGYNTFFRFPGDVFAAANEDIVMGGFSVIKTELNDDFLAFGVGVSLEHDAVVTSGSVQRYQAKEFGSFVFGPRFPTASMPTEGLAAYAGFSQAYAQSSNRNFLPFRGLSGAGGVIVNGFSAMVFSFDSNGDANFEHGYIDFLGSLFQNDGADEIRRTPTRHPIGTARSLLTLNANFASPEYAAGAGFADAATSVDASSLTPAAGFVGDAGDYEIDSSRIPDNTDSLETSHLFFILNGYDETADTMDFTMELVLPKSLIAPSCTRGVSNVVCYNSNRTPEEGPAGAGVVQFYGATVDLTSDSNNADNVPTFAGGVWQYEGIVYVDVGADGRDSSPGGNDRLLGVVDLYGSLGGLVVDNPAE